MAFSLRAHAVGCGSFTVCVACVEDVGERMCGEVALRSISALSTMASTLHAVIGNLQVGNLGNAPQPCLFV